MINLLPPEVKDDIRYGRLNVAFVQYIILLAVVMVLLIGLLLFGVQVVTGDQRSLEEAISDKEVILSELSADFESAKQLESTVDTIGQLLDREVVFSDLIREIGSVIPRGAVLTNLSLTGNAEAPLIIEAEVDSQRLAAVVRENLEQSDLFGFADIQSITVNDTDSAGNAVNYVVQIVVNFEQGAAR